MAQVRTDEVQLRVVIDGSPARKELAQLSQESVKLNDELKGMKKGSAEAAQALERLAQIGKRQAELRKDIGLTGLSLKELQARAAQLTAQMRTMVPGSEQWTELNAELLQVKTRIDAVGSALGRQAADWDAVRKQYKLTEMTQAQLEAESKRLTLALRNIKPDTAEFRQYRAELDRVNQRQAQLVTGLGPMGRAWQNIKGQMAAGVSTVGALLGIGALLQGFKSWVSGSAELSDAQAEVQRTTQLTDKDIKTLTKDLGQLNTRTARSELLDLAKEAGKLGVNGRDDVLAFVRAGDKINVALGEELGQGAITQIGKLNQTFKVGEATGKDLEGQMLSTGSAITVLGNNSTAAGAFIVDYTTRLAGSNVQAGISIEKTMGYAAALDQLGQRSETSSTAVSQFTLGAFKDTATYAQIAGMNVKEFSALLKTDANEALLRTLEGLNGNNAGLGEMVKKFGLMGEEGARATGVLASLAGNTKLVREQQKLATQSFAEGTAVLSAFDKKNSSFAANLDIIGKKLHAAFVNSAVVNGLNSMAAAVRRWIEIPVSETLEKERVELQKTYAMILTYNVGSTERTKLIKELQAQYPSFLANINAETVGNEQLGNAVRLLNEQLVNKIILQKKDEEIQAQTEAQAEQKMRVLELEDKVRERLVKLAEEYNLKLAEGVPLLQQSEALISQVEDIRKRAGSAGPRGIVFDELARFSKSVRELTISESFLNSEQARSNKLAEERTALMERLGIKLEQTASKAVAATPAPADVAAETLGGDDKKAFEDKLKTAREGMAKIRAELAEIRLDILTDAMSADQKELAGVDAKYNKLREGILKNETSTAADLDALDEAYFLARKAVRDKQHTLRLEEERRKAAELAKARQDAGDRLADRSLSPKQLEVQNTLSEFDLEALNFQEGSAEMLKLREQYEKKLFDIGEKYRAQEQAADREARLKKIDNFVQTAQGVGAALGGLQSILAASAAAQGKSAQEQSEFQRMLALTQIGIASAVGVAEAIKSGAGLGFPQNLAAIATGVGAVLSGIGSAMAIFNATPPTPSAPGTGNTNLNNVPIGEDGMVLDGPSHAQKGLKVYDPLRQRVVAEVEGGELLMSKKFTDANRPILPQLLAASKAGTRLNFISAPVTPINTGAVRQAMQVVHMAAGGIIHTRGTALVNMAGPGSDGAGNGVTYSAGTGKNNGVEGTPEWAAAMLDEMRAQRKATEQMAGKRFQAELVLNPKKDRTEERYAAVKARNTFKRKAA